MSEQSTIRHAFEETSLFNPAFLALLSRDAAKSHQSQDGGLGLPVSLVYLSVPLALHKPTRDELPRNSTAQMAEWTQQHPLLLAGLPDRVRAMRPLMSTAMRFGLRHKVLVATGGRLYAGSIKNKPADLVFTADVESCRKHARFLGRWMARQPDAITTLATWGMRP